MTTSDDFSSEAPGPDPLVVFAAWQQSASERGFPGADALSFATATPDGRPSVRTVLYKGMRDGAVRLVTNYESRKGEELAKNPHAALVFFWPLLDRQVRMEGEVARAPAAESDEYFAGRDRESQLGAWASHQSRPLASRAELDAELARVRARFEGRAVERPPHWGVLHFVPARVELWIGGSHRLHDRFDYERDGAAWRVRRLSP
ncbi:MAG TPA: pyridoxamine 5'-phosphate oxidase [Polyangiaceae bacterium]|nr:pyridoxamine 5'-phosphate oxidase [Polyangiaceae bacterium]